MIGVEVVRGVDLDTSGCCLIRRFYEILSLVLVFWFGMGCQNITCVVKQSDIGLYVS